MSVVGGEPEVPQSGADRRDYPERTSSSKRTHCRRSVQRSPSRAAYARNPNDYRERILVALHDTPLEIFEIMKRVNIQHQDDCQSLLLKMRDDGRRSNHCPRHRRCPTISASYFRKVLRVGGPPSTPQD